MEEDGKAAEWLLSFDWERDFDLRLMAPETLDAMENAFAEFLSTKTKAEVSKRAIENRIMIGAMNTSAEVAEHPHLNEKGSFQQVLHEDLEEIVTYSSPAIRFSDGYTKLNKRPPHIGEHNVDVYCKELGLTTGDLTALKMSGAI